MSIKTDNDILRFIKDSDQVQKNVYSEPKMPELRSDVFLNWTKTSSKNVISEMGQAQKMADSYKNMGMDEDQVRNVLVGEGYSVEMSKTASKSVFKEEGLDGIVKSYEDIKPLIEKLVTSMKRKDFMNLITASGKVKDAIVVFASETAKARFDETLNYIQERGPVQNLMDDVHEALQPHFDDEINKSYLLAEVKQDNVKLSEINGKTIYAMNDSDKFCSIDLNNASCSCERYASRNFEAFNIPCEHVVIAYNNTSQKALVAKIVKSLE